MRTQTTIKTINTAGETKEGGLQNTGVYYLSLSK